MTDDELNEWAAMADEATAGPFIVVEGDCHGSESDRWSVCAVRDGKSFFVATVENGAPGDTLETEQANAKLFAASRTAIPALVAEVRRLRASPPAWHDRPTGPGLWYKANGGTVSVIDCDMGTYIINNWPGGRVFGPIPADEGAQA